MTGKNLFEDNLLSQKIYFPRKQVTPKRFSVLIKFVLATKDLE